MLVSPLCGMAHNIPWIKSVRSSPSAGPGFTPEVYLADKPQETCDNKLNMLKKPSFKIK